MRPIFAASLLAAVALTAAAAWWLTPADVHLPDGGLPFASPGVAVDHDPDPDVVHVKLVAHEMPWILGPEHVVRAYGYNGSLPGPTIEAKVGDRVVIELENRLPEPTTIHWHGLRVAAAMDGSPAMMQPVEPGGTFVYDFVVPDAGTFWYHPHANEAVQMEKGLYGAFVVRDPADPIVADGERVLLVDDVKLDGRGIEPNGGFTEIHDGREGQVSLVDARHRPEIALRAGQVERWRVANVSSARYVKLALGGRTFRVVASDGGLLPAAREVTEVLLAPSDRVELMVGPFEEGASFDLTSAPHDRGAVQNGEIAYASVVVGAEAPSVAVVPDRLREIPWLAAPETPADRDIHLYGRLGLRGMEFTLDGETNPTAAAVHVGSVQVWDIVNEAPIDHPFHLHGFFFQVLSTDGVPTGDPALHDTANIPRGSTVRIAWSADDRPGKWMYHCHILEHQEAGMMADFDVIP